jgi:hypothetical protein
LWAWKSGDKHVREDISVENGDGVSVEREDNLSEET